jgi:DnaK suppressor protein
MQRRFKVSISTRANTSSLIFIANFFLRILSFVNPGKYGRIFMAHYFKQRAANLFKTRTMKLMKPHGTKAPVVYSQQVLDEFDALISKKLDEAQGEYAALTERLKELNENASSNMLTDSADAVALEELNMLLSRQRVLIENLSNALVRVRNKTFGICRETGELIPVERLRAVPHATLSIAAKNRRVASIKY